jgi:N-acetyl-gamma-glutamyl-phosphate reductase
LSISAGIIGAAGYTGYELIKLLHNHPNVDLTTLNSRTYAGKKVSSVYIDFMDKNLEYTDIGLKKLNQLDVVFLAVPNGNSMKIVPKLDCKIIDLSADYRFKDYHVYENIYKSKHLDPEKNAVYGLPELNKKKIKSARLVANPGCYATACILAALPIQKKSENIIFDCKSGYSGAGINKSYVNDPKNFTNNLIPYNLTKHRHKFEIEQFISSKVSFTPHVLPIFRGLMCTMHHISSDYSNSEKVKKEYIDYYRDCRFVRIADDIPELHDVQNNNNCSIGGFEIDDNNQSVIISVIDNLLKGASGQAVQNMNLMFKFDESAGLS